MTNHSKKRRVYINKSKKKLLKGGNINSFLEKIDTDKIIEIGRGGYGIVYLDITQANSVFKISNDGKCKDWNNEIEIYEILNKNNIDTDLCKIIKMKDYVNDGKICCIEFTRVINPRGNELNYTIQPIFQDENFNYKHESRGLFLGVNHLISENIFTIDTIKEYIKQLAILMARLHYKLKNNTSDIELIISREHDKIIIYVGDFDRAQFFIDYNEDIIDKLAESFYAVNYFPSEGDLYDIFSTNYIIEATNYGMQEIAKKVLKEYLKHAW
jgi:hypothetical protein